MQIETKTVAEQPYVYADGSAPMADPAAISQAMGEAFGRVMTFLGQNGIAPLGPPMTVYIDYDPNTLHFRAGLPVSAEHTDGAEGDVKSASLPSGEVLTFLHKGAYAKLRVSYGEAMTELAKQGKGFGSPTWEVYLNDPRETPEDELMTQVYAVPGPPHA